MAKATGESVGRFAQGIFRVQSQFARQIAQSKQRVAQLVHHLAAIAGLAGLVQLSQLFVDLLAHARGIGPVESHRACLSPGARGAHQGRCGARNSIERALASFLRLLGRLELGPVDQHRLRRLGLHFPEYMGMPAHQLGHDPVHDIVDPERALRVAQLGLKDNLQQQISQLLRVVAHVARLQGIHHLVGLLHQVGQQRFQGLLAIPRTAGGRQQPLDQADQIRQVAAGLLVRQRAEVERGDRRFLAHGSRQSNLDGAR